MCKKMRLWALMWLLMGAISQGALGQELGGPDRYEIIPQDVWNEKLLDRHRITIDTVHHVAYSYFPDDGWLVRFDLDHTIEVIDTLDRELLHLSNLVYLAQEHALLLWDAGLGRVFRYDFDTRELERLDQSYNFRGFYGHAEQFIDNDYSIYAFGGYGEFTKKNELIFYNNREKEWLDIPAYGDIPSKHYIGDLDYDSVGEAFYYTQYVDGQVLVYKLLPNNWKWVLMGTFELGLLFSSHTESGMQRIDPVSRLMYLFGGFFYDIEKNVVRKYVTNDEYLSPILHFRLGSYDPSHDRWLFIGDTKADGIDEYLYSFSLTLPNGVERSYSTIMQERNLSESTRILGYFTLGAVVLILIFFGFRYKSWVGVSSLKLRANSSIMLRPDLVLVDVGGETIRFTESTDLSFWNYVMDLKSKNIHSCELKDFDRQVLPSLSNESQYSVFRKRFISHVNEKLGLEFIEVKRSELDKRYRKVVFRHDLL